MRGNELAMVIVALSEISNYIQNKASPPIIKIKAAVLRQRTKIIIDYARLIYDGALTSIKFALI